MNTAHKPTISGGLALLVTAALGLGASGTALAARTDRAVKRAAPTLTNPDADCGVSAQQLPSDHLKVVGRRLKDSQGHVIVPEGISVVGGPEQPSYAAAQASTLAQIDAAHAAWHINSQRLQVSEGNLINRPTSGYGYNRKFATYLNQMICRILRDHEIPIVNDNTWFTGNRPDPTATTVKFWQYMSLNYRRWPVIFDLFNEPRLKKDGKHGPLMSDARIWKLWRWGGKVARVRYVGMQALVNDIRARWHASNVIWAESAYETSHTAQLPGHLLTGRNLMYSFHKLKLDEPSAWQAVGALAARGIALVDGEWTLFAALHRPWECYSDGYKSAPDYLAYWKSEGVGIEAWSLQPGALAQYHSGTTVHDGNYLGFTTDAAELEVPNVMHADFGCDSQSLGQGAGSLVMSYFKRNTVAAPPALFASAG
ncbi:MAG TPA: cellulase family glycosylhydrolase [Solirubrobacteraceae bacterium]|nr:cellulase family glycosylhydrolase [Solirubrobacteraceae bacterium]